jgi:hypothetical protein
MWDNNVWANMYRQLYTYDANNAQTSFTYQGWNGTAWENSSRYTYKNRNDGVHYEAVYCNWVNGEWYEADSTFTSFNEAGNPTMMKTYRYHHKESGYEKDEWVEASNLVYTYNDKGQQIQRLSQICYYAPEKTYSYNNKYYYEYDEKGDMSHHSYSYWYNNDWQQQHSKDYFYNDAHLLTQSILQNCSSGTCDNSQKEEYTYDAEGIYLLNQSPIGQVALGDKAHTPNISIITTAPRRLRTFRVQKSRLRRSFVTVKSSSSAMVRPTTPSEQR